ncbi:Uncharacterized membrane protein YcaP, DUF421 family [Thermomonospora echinospora]|uniref:Uncharacterized membrane protein YcaP, DUF421 family n=1 Tax=Thermomonospora echinospora TaxID=1992 RepID=A0A1H6DE97_9ACTN|nr:YetF domain-containing protein [Thermomonospora echinospora]SEG83554.1 Uncharacterized membrane protein YcaP, DUF421 family [Thermomonospora echinospora]
MWWLTGEWASLGAVVGKAALIYLAALLVLRLSQRRTLAEWTIPDFVTAVAVGAVVGRTAIASTQSFVTGVVALVTFVVLHRVINLARFKPVFGRLLEHQVRVLVAHGRIREDQLRLCGLTTGDLFAHLRQRGVFELSGIRYVLYETTGGLTVVPEEDDAGPVPELVRAGLRESRDFPERTPDRRRG